MKRRIISTMLALMLIVLMTVTLAACGADTPATQTPESTPTGTDDAQVGAETQGENESTVIGQGSTVFMFEVTDNNGEKTVWEVHTDETTVGAALLALGLVDGDMSDFGLFVTAVNGLVADFDENQAWWAFYIDGEMAMVGADGADIEEGVVYAFVYTVG
ncbi:MAG: DUF4430 domain-containing protein [Oscillospiraceae bacterium]|nr:DUF4430 domain-containing protein [Oscillospiraceae bacterium]MCL2278653.1 DUF4430 domain-containing protein [Oscillospiraceae bacterium]